MNSIDRTESEWLALAIGNSRLHWAKFQSGSLVAAWDASHPEPGMTPLEWMGQRSSQPDDGSLLLYIASVVPDLTAFWQTYPRATVLTLEQVPLRATYPTLGIDRALALWGAAQRYGLPALVIDAGTALTFTGANAQQELVGGAILPGLTLQKRSLSDQTAALPLVQSSLSLPPRWARTTAEAIASGIFYTVLASIQDFVADWQQEFGTGAIVLTGGDAPLILNGLQTKQPELAQKMTIDPHLVFWGMQAIVEKIP